jgi:NADH:ubiquinone oxidoreductase subunit E
VRRDASVEWEQRFGHEGTGILDRLHAAAACGQRINRDDLRAIADEFGRPVAAVAGAAGFYADFAGARGTRHVRIRLPGIQSHRSARRPT